MTRRMTTCSRPMLSVRNVVRICLMPLLVIPAPVAIAQENWQEVQFLRTPEGGFQHRFGSTVAINEDWLLIGAWYADARGEESGAAYVADAKSGELLYRILPDDLSAGDWFGRCVAINGNLAIIGAPLADNGGIDRGSVYVFDLTSGQQRLKITESEPADYNTFGMAAASQVDRMFVGSPLSEGVRGDTGAAYVFDLATGEELWKLAAPDGLYADRFGTSVTLSGARAIVGASGADERAPSAGAAYVFDTSTGELLQKLLADDGGLGDELGTSVAATESLVLVGSPNDDDRGANAGAAYVFDLSTGSQLFKLRASNGAGGDRFGSAVAMNEQRLIAGAPGYRQYSGAVYVFDPSTGSQVGQIVPDPARASTDFGIAIALDGHMMAVGAPRHDTPRGRETGVVYLFERISVLDVITRPMISGERAWFSIQSALPSQPLWLVYSLSGRGETFVAPLNVTIELAHPRLAGRFAVDADGAGFASLVVPSVADSRAVALQAVQQNLRSNVVWARVEPQ